MHSSSLPALVEFHSKTCGSCQTMENIIKELKLKFGNSINFISIDVAFISLTKVLIPVRELLKTKGEIVCLIKPQFEAGKENVGKKGVVRDSNIHLKVITDIVNFCVEHELNPVALTYSPVKGPEGNIEYLLYLRNEEVVSVEIDAELIQSIVTKSHEQL